MTSRRQLDQAQQSGFDYLERFNQTGDPRNLQVAVDSWRWVVQSTSDGEQRTFVLAAISVAMRRYHDQTSELWALQDAINAARAAMDAEQIPHRWVMAALYLGIADYEYFKSTQEKPYLEEAVAVLRNAAGRAADDDRGSVLSHLVVALELAYRSEKDDQYLLEAVVTGRQAARIPGQLQVDSICDLLRNLRELAGKREDLALLREGEAMARWAAQNNPDPRDRGRLLFELARTLHDVGTTLHDPVVLADAIAAGEGAIQMAPNEVSQRLRGSVIDGIRQRLREMDGRPDLPLPPV